MVSEERIRQLKWNILEKLREGLYDEETLAVEVGTNRSLARRLVLALRDEGFYIFEKNGKIGLRLDKIHFHDISGMLRTKILGKKVIFLEEVTSTMDVARNQYSMEGLVVLAEKQTAGRGRKNRTWFSPRGGLWFSVVLRPRNPPAYTSLISLFSSLAVSEAIEEVTKLNTYLKWPNDVYVNGKKVCGSLIEAIYELGEITSAISGIGINMNFTVNELPEEIRKEATTLMDELGRPVPPLILLCKILEHLEHYYMMFLRGKYPDIIDAWKRKSNILGRKVEVKTYSETLVGEVLDVDELGRLIFKDNSGNILNINVGNVDKLRMYE